MTVGELKELVKNFQDDAKLIIKENPWANDKNRIILIAEGKDFDPILEIRLDELGLKE